MQARLQKNGGNKILRAITNPPRTPNAVTRTLLCIDAVRDADFSGTLYNPYFPAPVPFGQVKDILYTLEDFFDRIAYPQADYQLRSFFAHSPEEPIPRKKLSARCCGDDIFSAHHGRLATFILEVRFRKNATWQGELYWVETQQSAMFYSVLEMLCLLDQAVQERQ